MDESSQHEVGAIGDLLLKHGAEAMMAAIATMCSHVASQTQGEQARRWHLAAEFQRQAVTALRQALSKPDDAPESEPSDAREATEGDDDTDDDLDVADDETEDADETSDDPAEASDDDTDTDDEADLAQDPLPRPRMPTAGGHSGSAAAPDSSQEDTTMAKNLLGPRPPDVTHFRIKSLLDGSRKGSPLFRREQGVAIFEWPIRYCTADTIRAWWGPGRYLVDYLTMDSTGTRRPRGRSRVLDIAMPEPEGTVRNDEGLEGEPYASPPTRASVAFAHAAPIAGEGSLGSLLSLVAFLEERQERERVSAAAEARLAAERAAAEARLAAERYRADMELQMERERLASRERIAQMEAQARAFSRAPAAPAFDPQAFALQVSQLIDTRMQEAIERFGEPSGDESDESDAADEGTPDAMTQMFFELAKQNLPSIIEHWKASQAQAAQAGAAPVSSPSSPPPRPSPASVPTAVHASAPRPSPSRVGASVSSSGFGHAAE